MTFRELVAGKGYSGSGGQEKGRMVRLEDDIAELGMEFEGWRKSAQKVGR